MNCYFCGDGASVRCPKCNRNACGTHSGRLNDGRYGCFECVLGGPEGVYREMLMRLQPLIKSCPGCRKRYLFRQSQEVLELSRGLWLHLNGVAQDLERSGVRLIDTFECRCCNCHLPNHGLTPIRIVPGTRTPTGKLQWEDQFYRCPKCGREWKYTQGFSTHDVDTFD